MANSKTKQQCAESEICTNKHCASQRQMREEMYDCLTGVSHLLLTARLQAREADIRARYAKQFAERSVSEAKSAHQVSEALAKTARVIASIALEFANKTDLVVDECHFLNPCVRAEILTSEESETNENYTKEDRPTKLSENEENVDNDQRHTPTEKYRTAFPSDMIPADQYGKHFETSPKLATVWECNPVVEHNEVDREVEGESDISRKMQIYKDSKKLLNKKSMETGDAYYQPREYADMGVQTVNHESTMLLL